MCAPALPNPCCTPCAWRYNSCCPGHEPEEPCIGSLHVPRDSGAQILCYYNLLRACGALRAPNEAARCIYNLMLLNGLGAAYSGGSRRPCSATGESPRGVFWLIWAALVPWPWVGSVCMSVRSVSSDRYVAHRARARNAVNRAGTRVGHAGCAGERRKYTFLSRGWAAWVGYSPLTRKTPPEGATTRRAGAPAAKASLGSFRETREEIIGALLTW